MAMLNVMSGIRVLNMDMGSYYQRPHLICLIIGILKDAKLGSAKVTQLPVPMATCDRHDLVGVTTNSLINL